MYGEVLYQRDATEGQRVPILAVTIAPQPETRACGYIGVYSHLYLTPDGIGVGPDETVGVVFSDGLFATTTPEGWEKFKTAQGIA